jgi:hypothetical protein
MCSHSSDLVRLVHLYMFHCVCTISSSSLWDSVPTIWNDYVVSLRTIKGPCTSFVAARNVIIHWQQLKDALLCEINCLPLHLWINGTNCYYFTSSPTPALGEYCESPSLVLPSYHTLATVFPWSPLVPTDNAMQTLQCKEWCDGKRACIMFT